VEPQSAVHGVNHPVAALREFSIRRRHPRHGHVKITDRQRFQAP
jgi:hypothetical protein